MSASGYVVSFEVQPNESYGKFRDVILANDGIIFGKYVRDVVFPRCNGAEPEVLPQIDGAPPEVYKMRMTVWFPSGTNPARLSFNRKLRYHTVDDDQIRPIFWEDAITMVFDNGKHVGFGMLPFEGIPTEYTPEYIQDRLLNYKLRLTPLLESYVKNRQQLDKISHRLYDLFKSGDWVIEGIRLK